MTGRGCILAGLAILAILCGSGLVRAEETRPNILWITCEDMSPNLGCYGDKDAITPNLDKLAQQGVRFTNAYSVAGVCAPSRSCIITGMYPSTLGSHYMRCRAPLPREVRCFTEYLREAGYYCSNNVKQDYNFATPPSAWGDSSRKAHWRNRKKGQPFFSVFNLTVTHEGQIRTPEPVFRKQTARLTAAQRHDPTRITVPPYHPDTPVVRSDWARYHDLITAMDRQAADLLEQLEADKLADNTIVFFFSDHGVGLPRGKRWLYDTGLRVPLITRFPARWQSLAPGKPGSTNDQLISLLDLAPTVLSLAGVKAPSHLQGSAFLGEAKGKPREYIFGIRDRMDERNDCTRAVRTGRYKYIRNYHAYKPWAQVLDYMEQMPTMQEWRKLAQNGKLTGAPALFMRPSKPFEELYDTHTDPHELRNLAGSAEHQKVLERLRATHLNWMKETRDLGLLPEYEVWARSKGSTPFEMGKDARLLPSDRLLQVAELLHAGNAATELPKYLNDSDSAIRWWAVTGLGVVGKKDEAVSLLEKALADPVAGVRVAAAEGLRRQGQGEKGLKVLTLALADANPWVRHAAALGLDELGTAAKPALPALRKAVKDENEYVVRVVKKMLKELE